MRLATFYKPPYVDLIPPRTSGALETAPSLVFRDNDIGGTKSVLTLFIVTDGGDGGLETEGVVILGSLGITVRLRYGKDGHNLVFEGKLPSDSPSSHPNHSRL